jgi:hypothetical protein
MADGWTMTLPSRRMRTARIVGVFVVLVLFAANVGRVFSLGMENRPPIWVVDAIPIALSDMVFGHRNDYTSLTAVDSVFYHTLESPPGQTHDSKLVARAIANVLALDPRTISRESMLPGRTLGTDDKGIVDFVKLAFAAFGYANERIIYLYFVFLFVSISLLLLFFGEGLFSQLAVGAFLTAHYLILPMVFYNGQLQSVLALRFLPVLGMMPCLHCLYFVLRPRATWDALGAVVVQVLFLAFVLHMRSVTAWEMAIIAVTGVIASLRVMAIRWQGRREQNLFDLAAPLIPACLIAICVLGLRIYRQVCYDTRFFHGEQMVTRVFWHNILSGFAFDPTLAARYNLKVDDFSEKRAVGVYLITTGRADEWKAMGGGTSKLLWPAYDKAAGELFWAVGRHDTGDFLASALYYKPLALAHDLAWLYGFQRDVPDIDIFVSPDIGRIMEVELKGLQGALDRHHQRFILWSPPALLLLIAFSVLLSIPPGRIPPQDWVPFAILAAGSLIPTFVGYPGLHAIAEPAIMCAAVIFVGVAIVGARILASCGVPWAKAKAAPSP